MKVLVKGAYGSFNFGDDLLLAIITRIFHELNCDVDILCSKQDYIYNVVDFNIDINDGTYSKEYDILVYGGGTQFYSFHNEDKQLKERLNDYLYRFWDLFSNPKRIKGAFFRRIGKNNISFLKTVYIGVGVGPFIDHESKGEILSGLNGNDFLLVRDQVSIQHLSDLGINSTICPDLCFTPYIQKYLPKKKCIKRIKNIAFILRDWDYTEDLDKRKVKEILTTLSAGGYNVTFVLFSKLSDRNWFKELHEIDKIKVWNPEIERLSSFVEYLNSFDLIISSRFHGLVMASILEIPFIGMNIEPKISIFCDRFNFDNLIKPNFCLSDLNEKIELINANLAEVIPIIKDVNEQEFKKGAEMLNKIKGYIS